MPRFPPWALPQPSHPCQDTHTSTGLGQHGVLRRTVSSELVGLVFLLSGNKSILIHGQEDSGPEAQQAGGL